VFNAHSRCLDEQSATSAGAHDVGGGWDPAWAPPAVERAPREVGPRRAARRHANQALVAGEAEDEVDPMGLALRHELIPGEAGIRPEQDLDLGPARARIWVRVRSTSATAPANASLFERLSFAASPTLDPWTVAENSEEQRADSARLTERSTVARFRRMVAPRTLERPRPGAATAAYPGSRVAWNSDLRALIATALVQSRRKGESGSGLAHRGVPEGTALQDCALTARLNGGGGPSGARNSTSTQCASQEARSRVFGARGAIVRPEHCIMVCCSSPCRLVDRHLAGASHLWRSCKIPFRPRPYSCSSIPVELSSNVVDGKASRGVQKLGLAIVPTALPPRRRLCRLRTLSRPALATIEAR
jgi:hypothetical protein